MKNKPGNAKQPSGVSALEEVKQGQLDPKLLPEEKLKGASPVKQGGNSEASDEQLRLKLKQEQKKRELLQQYSEKQKKFKQNNQNLLKQEQQELIIEEIKCLICQQSFHDKFLVIPALII